MSDARDAHDTSVRNGAVSILAPSELIDKRTGQSCVISEIQLFGDSVIRWISGNFEGPFLPGYEASMTPDISYGIMRLDHAVSNIPNLFTGVDYLMKATGRQINFSIPKTILD